MKHISISYSPIAKKWQAMADGTQDRRVIFNGSKAECLRLAIDTAKDLNQPLYIFNRKGLDPYQLLP